MTEVTLEEFEIIMSLPKPSLMQPGYRKEITLSNKDIYNLTNIRKSQFSLSLELVNFNTKSTFILGAFIIEYAYWNRISTVMSLLENQIVTIDFISPGDKPLHKWTTQVLSVEEVKEEDHSGPMPTWTIICKFSIPMIEVGLTPGGSNSFVNAWWHRDF